MTSKPVALLAAVLALAVVSYAPFVSAGGPGEIARNTDDVGAAQPDGGRGPGGEPIPQDENPSNDGSPGSVLDLLNQTVALDTLSGASTWASAPFSTARFSRMILRASAESADGVICCGAAWQFIRDDAFLPGWPVMCPGADVLLGDDRGLDLPTVRVRYPLGYAGTNIAEVAGLRARIVCRLTPLAQSPGDPEDPPQASGTLTDVKVLLRSY